MTLNARGFWRVLVVIYGLIVIGTTVWAASEIRWNCAERQQELESWARMPLCRGDQNWGERCIGATVIERPNAYCKTPVEGAGTIAGVLVGSFLGLFGSGLIVRWVYRGFTQPSA